jgi:uncharacterized membrane protein
MRSEYWRVGTRWFMGVCYVAAGVAHFALTRNYEAVVPGWIPAHREMVLLSGVFEVLGGMGVMLPDRFAGTRRAAAWGIVCLLIAVWPVHFWMLQHPELYPRVSRWALWVRLPLQIPLILWAWTYTRRRLDTGRSLDSGRQISAA